MPEAFGQPTSPPAAPPFTQGLQGLLVASSSTLLHSWCRPASSPGEWSCQGLPSPLSCQAEDARRSRAPQVRCPHLPAAASGQRRSLSAEPPPLVHSPPSRLWHIMSHLCVRNAAASPSLCSHARPGKRATRHGRRPPNPAPLHAAAAARPRVQPVARCSTRVQPSGCDHQRQRHQPGCHQGHQGAARPAGSGQCGSGAGMEQAGWCGGAAGGGGCHGCGRLHGSGQRSQGGV